MGFLDFWDNLIDGNEGNSSGNIIGGRQKLVNDLTGSNTTSNTVGSTTSTGSVVPQPGVTNNPYADIGNKSNAGSVNNTSNITNRKAATGSNNATASGGENRTSYIYNNKQVIPEVPAWTPSKSNLINPWENMNKNGASQITWPGGEEKAAKERNRDELEKISSQHLAEERAYNEAKAEEEKNRRQRENTSSAHLAEERAYNEAKVEEERTAQINELASTISDMVPETEEEEIRKNQYMQELLIGTFNNDYELINDLEERVSNDLTEKDLNNGLAAFNRLIEDNESLSYIYDSLKQVVGGNYYEGDPTLLGTAAQVALGLTGLDFAADIRDLTHDLTNWEWTPQHIGGTLLDAIGLLPVVGSLKFADELGAVAKNGIKALDEVSDTMKATDKALDGAEDIAKAGKKSDILAKNRAQGRSFEQKKFSEFSKDYIHAQEQITVKTSNSTKIRLDAIGLDTKGNIVINEFKSSMTAPLTNNQRAAFPEMFDKGGTVVGKGKGIFTGGYKIPEGTDIKIIRP